MRNPSALQHRARVQIKWMLSEDRLHTQTNTSYFQKCNTEMHLVMNYRYSSSLTITSASAQWYLPTAYHKYFITDSSSHFHCKSTFVLWVVLISQTIDENNSSPLSPNMRFKKKKSYKFITIEILTHLKRLEFLNAVSVAYTCTFNFENATKMPKKNIC